MLGLVLASALSVPNSNGLDHSGGKSLSTRRHERIWNLPFAFENVGIEDRPVRQQYEIIGICGVPRDDNFLRDEAIKFDFASGRDIANGAVNPATPHLKAISVFTTHPKTEDGIYL